MLSLSQAMPQDKFLSEMILAIEKQLVKHRPILKMDDLIDKLCLGDLLESRFTVAIVGQMRSGKSTLLNALVGRDLAPTAVNECTATVNSFSYSSTRELHDKFRVRWRDKTKIEEYFPLNEVHKWIGRGENVDRTKQLDFFADTDFLRIANIVDTPGLRSTLETHEQNVLSYLSQKDLEVRAEEKAEQTRKEGNAADAVVYVVNPVGRQKDKEILDLFGEKTRLPGSNAYNSIAVVHKWEPDWQDLDVDPLQYARNKCNRLEHQLQGRISCVIPGSGLLSRALHWLTREHWDFFTQFAKWNRSQVEDLTDSQAFHDANDSSLPVEFKRRLSFLESITNCIPFSSDRQNASATAWQIYRFLGRFAHVRSIKSGDCLRQATNDISGLGLLKDILQKRFFARAQLIKAGTVLTRIWEPCNIALEQMRHIEKDRMNDRIKGQTILNLLQDKAARDESLIPAVQYVKKTFDALEGDALRVESARKELFSLKSKAERFWQKFEEDIMALEMLDCGAGNNFSEEESKELRALFGGFGTSLNDRLISSEKSSITYVQERYTFWAQKRLALFGDAQKIAGFAQDRLEAILDALESTTC